MEDLQPLLDLLSGRYGWLASLCAWMGALRVAAKPICAALNDGVQKAIARAVESEEEADNHIVQRLLRSPVYQVLAFALDWLTSIKLPTLAMYRAAQAARKGGA